MSTLALQPEHRQKKWKFVQYIANETGYLHNFLRKLNSQMKQKAKNTAQTLAKTPKK
jgi:hypothetical protein